MNIIDRGSTSHGTRTRQGKSEVFMVVELEPADYDKFFDFMYHTAGIREKWMFHRFFQ